MMPDHDADADDDDNSLPAIFVLFLLHSFFSVPSDDTPAAASPLDPVSFPIQHVCCFRWCGERERERERSLLLFMLLEGILP